MVHVTSEVGRLRRVIVQPPGANLERMLPAHIQPAHPDYLLFDDLVHVPGAQREHDDLRAVLETAAEVVRLDDLIAEVLAEPPVRAEVIERIAQLEHLDDGDVVRLGELEPEALTRSLIVGTLGGELDGPGLMKPVPNIIFTRDLAAVAGPLVIVGNASKPARRRETILTWAVVDHHPLFANAPVSEASRDVRLGGWPLTVEGGDVLVISSSLACIGASERTSWSMIIHLADELLDTGFTRVLVVEMAKQRSSMHLDTVFTMVDWDRAVVYRPVVEPGSPEEASVIRLRRVGGATVVEELGGDLLDALTYEGHPMQAVWCGANHPIHARREQWTDGANYLAIGPGIVVGYSRNVRTAREMAAAGFEVVDAQSYLDLFERDFAGDFDALLASGRRMAIHIHASELARGRGGPRCLTFPVERD